VEKAKNVALGLVQEARYKEYSREHVAELLKLVADCEDGLGNHGKAIELYKESLDHNEEDLTKVFFARALCNENEIGKAAELLTSISDDNLKDPGKFDLAISWAQVAASSLETEHINTAKERLERVDAHDPVFIELRHRLMIDLLKATPSDQPSLIRKFLRSINKYLILEPNVCGIGINLNRILEEVAGSDEGK
jgi:tetratricopeptide (TPR) repeat protein